MVGASKLSKFHHNHSGRRSATGSFPAETTHPFAFPTGDTMESVLIPPLSYFISSIRVVSDGYCEMQMNALKGNIGVL